MEYRVYFDITVSTTIYVDAENEEQAKELARKKYKEDPFHYAYNCSGCGSGDVVDVEEC